MNVDPVANATLLVDFLGRNRLSPGFLWWYDWNTGASEQPYPGGLSGWTSEERSVFGTGFRVPSASAPIVTMPAIAPAKSSAAVAFLGTPLSVSDVPAPVPRMGGLTLAEAAAQQRATEAARQAELERQGTAVRSKVGDRTGDGGVVTVSRAGFTQVEYRGTLQDIWGDISSFRAIAKKRGQTLGFNPATGQLVLKKGQEVLYRFATPQQLADYFSPGGSSGYTYVPGKAEAEAQAAASTKEAQVDPFLRGKVPTSTANPSLIGDFIGGVVGSIPVIGGIAKKGVEAIDRAVSGGPRTSSPVPGIPGDIGFAPASTGTAITCPSGYRWNASTNRCEETGVAGVVHRVLPGGSSGTAAPVAALGGLHEPLVTERRTCGPGWVLAGGPEAQMFGIDGLCVPDTKDWQRFRANPERKDGDALVNKIDAAKKAKTRIKSLAKSAKLTMQDLYGKKKK